jgi:hypothetical protein
MQEPLDVRQEEPRIRRRQEVERHVAVGESAVRRFERVDVVIGRARTQFRLKKKNIIKDCLNIANQRIKIK